MFDVGFSEIVVIAVVALIVIGPERLPKVARTLGHLFGRMQRYVNDVKADISREMELDELRKLQQTVQDAAQAVETTVNKEINSAQSELTSIGNAASDALKPAEEAAPAATTAAAAPVTETPALATEAAAPAPAASNEPARQAQLDLGEGTSPARKQA